MFCVCFRSICLSCFADLRFGLLCAAATISLPNFGPGIRFCSLTRVSAGANSGSCPRSRKTSDSAQQCFDLNYRRHSGHKSRTPAAQRYYLQNTYLIYSYLLHFHPASMAQLRIMNDASDYKVAPTRFEIFESMRSILLETQLGAPHACGCEPDTLMTIPDGLPHQLFRTSNLLGVVTSVPTAPTAAQEHSQKIGQCGYIASKTINDCFRNSSIGGPVVHRIGCFIQSSFCPLQSLNPRFSHGTRQ